MIKSLTMDSKKVEKISKALADPNRLYILNAIKKKKQSQLYCWELYSEINLAQPSICHHLKQLVDADLILSEKEGRNVKYSLNDVVLDQYIGYLESLKV